MIVDVAVANERLNEGDRGRTAQLEVRSKGVRSELVRPARSSAEVASQAARRGIKARYFLEGEIEKTG